MLLRRTSLVLAATALLLPLAACNGPAGVELGRNWAGSKVFVLAKVGGLTTVTGIDPVQHTAEPLAAVPTQSDDDHMISPRITRTADGRWLVTVPRKDGRPSRLYEVNTKEHSLDAIAEVEGGRVLVPAGDLVAAVADRSTAAGKAGALIYDPATWQVKRDITLPIDAKLATGGGNRLCAGDQSDTSFTLATVAPETGTTELLPTIRQIEVQALDCSTSRPLLAGGPATTNSPQPADSATLKLTPQGGVDVLTTTAGRIDRVAADQATAVAVVALADHLEVVELDRTSGKELRRTKVEAMAAADGLRRSGEDWVISSGDSTTVVDLTGNRTARFALPGQLLDAG